MPNKLDLLSISTQTSKNVIAPNIPYREDGWRNVMTGMGTSRDKRRYTTFDATYLLSAPTLSNMYVGDGLAARIVDTFADDMTREWGYARNDPAKENASQGVIETELERLDASNCINQSVKWARLFGGSLLYIGAMDGSAPSEKLNMDKVRSIDFLRVIELPDILTYDCIYDEDLRSPTFGQIQQYAVQFKVNDKWIKMMVHATRCIPFFGRKVPYSMQGLSHDARYWGVSVLQPVIDYLRDFTGAMGATSSILLEFIIGKYKFSDLDEMLAKGNENMLRTRIEAIDMTKSTIHSVVLGIDEEYTRDAATVTGIADIIDRFMMNLSAVTEYPVTKLFGRSPAGMNATGENDLKNYYDGVRSRQAATTRYIQNLINMIAKVNKLSGEYPWEWNPLFQLSDKDNAEVLRVDAETARTYADADQRMLMEGVLMPADVWKMRFEKILGPRDEDEFELPEEEPVEDPLNPEDPEGAKEKGEEELDEPDNKSGDKKAPKNAK